MKELKKIILDYSKTNKTEMKVVFLALGITIFISIIPVIMFIQSVMIIYSNKFIFNLIIFLLLFFIMFLYNYIYYDIYKNIIPDLNNKKIEALAIHETGIFSLIIIVLLVVNGFIRKWW